MMIPAGYLLKRTTPPPGWLQPNTSNVSEVCSVSDCVNDNMVDLLSSWRFNQFGLANSRHILLDLAQEAGIDLSTTSLFFYSAYEFELESDGWEFDPDTWRQLTLSDSAGIENDVIVPEQPNRPMMLGYDVVAYGDFPDHSPLSCNSIASHLAVNEFCLFDNCDTAKKAINTGKFGGGCEEGIYRIISVSRLLDWKA